MTQYITHDLFLKVKNHFRGDKEKAWTWFQSLNPVFGVSPLEMIKNGKYKQLEEFIDNELRR